MSLLSYVGNGRAQPELHDGGLARCENVETVCVLRADREHPSRANGDGWAYNHAPMLAGWHNRFWLSFLSSPRDEHAAPCRTLLSTSCDGFAWQAPRELFPPFPDDAARVIMHQRCGFYRAPNDVLLALGFYGVVSGEDGPPFGHHGIGRVVRRVLDDGTLGEIYYLRVNSHRAHRVEPQFPHFFHADEATKTACETLLRDRVKNLEFWDEELNRPHLFAHANVAHGLSAVSVFRRDNKQLIGVGKWGRVIFSDDDGTTWNDGGTIENLPTNGAKVWAQKLSDGQFCLVLNPTTDNHRRWPLAIVTSRDGLKYDDLRCVGGDVPPLRYEGRFKDCGPQYVRGLEVGDSPDGALWLAYSMNKEDIYVARVPLDQAQNSTSSTR